MRYLPLSAALAGVEIAAESAKVVATTDKRSKGCEMHNLDGIDDSWLID
jgi:hypothetical protein